jgi:transcriptional regulator
MGAGLLTEKELQILLLRKEGLLQKEIAKRLGINQSVVSRFEANARAKIAEAKEDLALLKAAGIEYEQSAEDPQARLHRLQETLRRMKR